ncbi:MAG TPA: exopolysaccharide biosynthesis protein, partial [Bacteroidales bacterium]
MDSIGLFFRFIYRIRHWLILGPAFVTILAIYFSSDLPKKYEASTTIFTGIMSSANVQEDKTSDWNTTNNAFDNIINLVHSRSTLERVSIRLFAQAMIKGDLNKDNVYIRAESYKDLINRVPKDVRLLIDKNDEQQTVQNLLNYKKEDKNNFLYGLLNYSYRYFSFNALKAITVTRLQNSDIIEIKYSCEDPGIATQTLNILNEELITEYTNLQLGPSNNVIDYFENQLKSIQDQLKVQEDSLMEYSINGKIINYEEQTKQLTTISANLDD